MPEAPPHCTPLVELPDDVDEPDEARADPLLPAGAAELLFVPHADSTSAPAASTPAVPIRRVRLTKSPFPYPATVHAPSPNDRDALAARTLKPLNVDNLSER